MREATDLEEEAHDEHLQGSHADDHETLDQADVDDPLLGAADRAEVAVLSRPEVLLVSRYGRQLARDLVDGLLQDGRVLWRGALLRRKLHTRLVLDLCGRQQKGKQQNHVSWGPGTDRNLKVDKLLAVRAHVVVEAERVLSNLVRRENEVALPLLLALHDDLVIRPCNDVVDIKGPSGLDLSEQSAHRTAERGSSEQSASRLWTHRKVEGDLGSLRVSRSIEARLLVRQDPVRQRRRRHRRRCPGQEAPGYYWQSHCGLRSR